MNKCFGVGLASLGLLLIVVLPAQATTVFLSGDTNIINAVDGSAGQPIYPGNQRFFSNILGVGTNVLVHDNCAGCTLSLATAISAVNDYYNSVAGVTSNTHSGAVTAGALAGVNLFVSILPASVFTASEISALSGFGGDILFLGENGNAAPTQNGRINAALAGLGSSMSLLNTAFDGGYHDATGAQIAVDPYTSGITSFRYAAPSEAAVAGGTALFFGTGAEPFIAYQKVGSPVPEPTILMLLGLGVGGLIVARRRLS